MPVVIVTTAKPDITVYTSNFNDADLKANREGRLSDAQVKRLHVELGNVRSTNRVGFWSWVILFALFMTCVLINFYTYGSKDLATMLSRLVNPVFVVMLLALIFALVCNAISYWWTSHRLINSPIRMGEGTVKVIGPQFLGYGVWVYTVEIKGKGYWRFKFTTPEALSHFETGCRYRVYYLPYREVALSAEEIEPEKAKQ